MSRRELAFLAPIMVALGAIAVIVATFSEREARVRERECAERLRAEQQPDFELRIDASPRDAGSWTTEIIDVEQVGLCDRVRREVLDVRGAAPWAGEYSDA